MMDELLPTLISLGFKKDIGQNNVKYFKDYGDFKVLVTDRNVDRMPKVSILQGDDWVLFSKTPTPDWIKNLDVVFS